MTQPVVEVVIFVIDMYSFFPLFFMYSCICDKWRFRRWKCYDYWYHYHHGIIKKNLGVSFFQLHVPRAYDEDHRDRGWPFHNAKRSCEYFFLLFLATNIHSCWLKTLFHYAKRSREYFLAIYPNIHSYWLKTCIVSLCFTMQSARVTIYSSLLLAPSCWL